MYHIGSKWIDILGYGSSEIYEDRISIWKISVSSNKKKRREKNHVFLSIAFCGNVWNVVKIKRRRRYVSESTNIQIWYDTLIYGGISQ